MITIHKSKKYIKYLNSINKNIVKELNVKKYKKNGLLGNIFYSKTSGLFKVMSIDISSTRPIYYNIKFCDTGYETKAIKFNILRGTIKDYMSKSLYEIASYGKDYIYIQKLYPELCKILVSRWNCLLRRIYDKNDINYNRYGGSGVKISSDWLVFTNFFNDVKYLLEKENILNEFIDGKLHIDKDILQNNIPNNKKIYSKETISFVTKIENNMYRNTDMIANKNSNYFIAEIDGIRLLKRNIRKFARDNNLDSRRICECIKNNKPLKKLNYRFRYPTSDEMNMITSGKLKENMILN